MSDSTATNPYEQERRQKAANLRALGVDPYGQRTPNLQPLSAVKSSYTPDMGHDAGPVVTVAGRVILKRDFGKKLSFLTLRDETGDLQIALDAKRLPELDWAVRDNIDLGDILVATGPLGTTKTGEVTVWSTHVAMAAKALLPPPAKHEGLTNTELRYRQRYVDLWANPDVLRTLKLRIAIVDEIRSYMKSQGYLEVETPMMQPLAGGAAARPFVTHHNALDIPLYMRIAPELYLKRLLVGGFSKIFELNRNFRNEGISPRHNPEFTMLEAYEAYGSWETMADLVEGMICHLAEKLFGSLKIEHKNPEGQITKTINLSRPWRRVRMVDLVEERTGWKFDKRQLQNVSKELFDKVIGLILGRANVAVASRVTISNPQGTETVNLVPSEPDIIRSFSAAKIENEFKALTAAEQLQTAYEKLIEPTLIDPCFVTHVPSVIIPLARPAKDDPFFADVYELAINGQEISPGYTELNDPDVQAQQFGHQVGDEAEKQKIDHDFLTALKYGMPPAGGMGLGVDRLVMMLTGAESIRDVILFPLMKPQQD